MSKRTTAIVAVIGLAAVVGVFAYGQHQLKAARDASREQLFQSQSDAAAHLSYAKNWAFENVSGDVAVRSAQTAAVLSQATTIGLNQVAEQELKAAVAQFKLTSECGYKKNYKCEMATGHSAEVARENYLWYASGPALLKAYGQATEKLSAEADAAEARGEHRVAVYLYYYAGITEMWAALSSMCDARTPEPCARLKELDALDVQIGSKRAAILEKLYGPPSTKFQYPPVGLELQTEILHNGGPRKNEDTRLHENRIEGLTEAEEVQIVKTILDATVPAVTELTQAAELEAKVYRFSVAANLYDRAAQLVYRGNLFDLKPNSAEVKAAHATATVANGDAIAERLYGNSRINHLRSENWYVEDGHRYLAKMWIVDGM